MKKLKLTPLQGVVILFLLTGLLVAFTGSYFFYYILVTIFVSVLLMAIIVMNNGRKIFQFLTFSSQELVAGESLRLDITSTNNSIFPVAHAKISCKIFNENKDMILPSENIFFNPFQIISMHEDFTINTRGIYTDSVLITEFEDPLRLFKKTIKYDRPMRLIVYPKIHELTHFVLPTTGYLGTNRVTKSGHEDYSSLKKVRPYTTGDSMKKIHWKISSKRQELFVKEYDSTSSTKVNVFLDAYTEHYKKDEDRIIEDCAVEIAASVIKYTLSQNAETSMIYQGSHNVKIESRDLASYPNVLKDLVTFVAKGDLAFSELVSQETRRFEQGSFVVLITPQINPGLINTLVGLKRRSFIVSLILVSDSDEYDQRKDLIRALDINLYDIKVDDDIKQKLEAYQ